MMIYYPIELIFKFQLEKVIKKLYDHVGYVSARKKHT